MNRIYRLIRSRKTGQLVAASEIAKGDPSPDGVRSTGVVGRKRPGRRRASSRSWWLGGTAASLVLISNAAYAVCGPTQTGSLTIGQSVETCNDSEPGLSASGVTVTAPGNNTILTHGLNSDGVVAQSGGNVTLVGTAVTVEGNGSNAVNLSGASSVTMDANTVLNVHGNGGTGLNNAISGIRMRGTPGQASTLNVNGSTIVTTGTNALGADIQGVLQNLNIQGASFTTSGDQSIGMLITTSGTPVVSDTTIHTSGAGATGLLVGGGSGTNVTISGGSITVDGSSIGAQVVSSSTINMNGATVNAAGAGSTGLSVESGAVLNLGATTPLTVNATGAGAVGLVVGSTTTAGTATLGNATVSAGANASDAVRVNQAGSSISVAPTTLLEAAGAGAHGIAVSNGAVVTFDPAAPAGTTVLPRFSVTGDGGAAIDVNGANSQVRLNNATLDATQAASLNLGANSWGVLAENGGTAVIDGTTSLTGVGLWARGSGPGAVGLIQFRPNATVTNVRARVDDYGQLDISPRTNGSTFTLDSLEGVGTAGTGEVLMGPINLQIAGAEQTTYAGRLTGNGDLIRSGTGSLTLTGANALTGFSGTAHIQDTATLGLAGAAQGAGIAFDFSAPGSTLDISGSTAASGVQVGRINSIAAGDGTISLGANNLTVSSSLPSDFSGTIQDATGSGRLTKAGTGTLTLSGANVFNFGAGTGGGVLVQDGTLAVTGQTNASQRTFNVSGPGVLDVSAVSNANGNFTAGMISGDGTINLGANSLTVDGLNNLDGTNTGTFSGTLTGGNATGMGLIKQGAGTLILSGSNAFGYVGGTDIQSGVLAIRNVTPTTFTKTFTLDGGWLDLSDVGPPNESNANNWPNIVINQGANANQGGVIGADDNMTYNVAAGATQTVAYHLGDGSTPNGQGIFVVKQGAGTLELTGDNHYVGNTRIEGGTLRVTSDSNLGDTTVAREVVLNGGNLDIGGSFVSARNIELRAAGAVEVESGQDTTWRGAVDNGAGYTLTKNGAGRLAFSGASHVGGVIANAGTLDMGAATVDSTTAGTAAVAVHGSTVGFAGGTINSADDTIVSDGSSVVNLANTTLNAAAGKSLYRVASGQGTLNANGQVLTGDLRADAGAGLTLNLNGGSVYTGTPSLGDASSTAAINVNDASSVWNVTGDTSVTSLGNSGTVAFGAPVNGAYKSLTVNGDYRGGGTIVMNTVLNTGGALADQSTDRLLIKGNASGTTTLQLQTTGTGANTNTSLNNLPVPTEGISLVQVSGNSSANAFQLAGGYVAANGSPYQYRVFAYGPGQTAASQSALGSDPLNWDYRLQTAYLDPHGNPVPGVPPSQGGGGGRPALVAQGSSDLVAPLALQNYGATVMGSLNRRLGEIRGEDIPPPDNRGEMFSRVIASSSSYRSNRDFDDYGYDFHQDIQAMQIGGNWLHLKDRDQNLRLGAAVTIGSTSVRPKTQDAESSKFRLDMHSVALTGTWQHKSGWYVDGVLSAGTFNGDVKTDKSSTASRIKGNSLEASVETGKAFALDNGFVVEPQFQLMSQTFRFDDHTDVDGVRTNWDTNTFLTARGGVKVSIPVPSAPQWKPYVAANLLQTWGGGTDVKLADTSFSSGTVGTALQLQVGATGRLTKNLSVYGELAGQQRLGHGTSSVYGNVGIRYLF
ncbi:Autotransporter domain-containing protein [Bordetella sputigena]|uniref:autotransporter outer membrane beta-barrel domain-containing protein n=1 Tax=Bordetella sputigena TaxID=1416810 RepID=UPI0039F126C0